jgi:hypothetical protein
MIFIVHTFVLIVIIDAIYMTVKKVRLNNLYKNFIKDLIKINNFNIKLIKSTYLHCLEIYEILNYNK